MNFQDKVAIITGASSGIGYHTAKLLAKNGAIVALAARSKDKLELLAKELPNALVIPTDMTKIVDITRMVSLTKKQYGRIDILINCAGQGYDAYVEDINNDLFHHVFDLDLLGPVIAMQQVIPIMRKQKSGTIVNISSGTALMTLPGMSAYASLKQALAKISLTAHIELQKDSISVIVVYPFITDTDFEKHTIRSGKEHEWTGDGNRKLPPADSPEFVAEQILAGIQSGESEVYVHEWMHKR